MTPRIRHQSAGLSRPGDAHTTRRFSVGTALAAIVLAAGAVSGCADKEEGRFAAAGQAARTSTTVVEPATPAGIDDGEPSGRPSNGGTAFPGATTTTTFVPIPAPQALLSAVDAFRSTPGQVKTLELTVQFPQSGTPYGSLQYVVPDAPNNVDERDWRNGQVHDATPVRLTPMDDVSTAWDLDSVNWPAVAAAMPGLPTMVEQGIGAPLPDSSGITHLIAQNGAPFYDGIVVRVYVDGGTRHSGGYVALRPDGTVLDVVV